MKLVKQLLDKNNTSIGYIEYKNEEDLKNYIDLYNTSGFARKIANTKEVTKWEMVRRNIKLNRIYGIYEN
jgi:hypothetical protein